MIIFILFTSSVALSAPAQLQEDQSESVVTGGVYTPGVDDPPELLAITGLSDFATQGTSWVSERPNRFRKWKVWGWGSQVAHWGSSTPADEWVHLPLTTATYIDGTKLYVSHVEFCAQSTNGALTKPTILHVRANEELIGNIPITWSDNAYHCAYINFSPAKWAESVGISVRLHFANATDQITLYKGWVRMVTAP